MTRAIVARQRGDKFQARIFWLNAASLLDPEGAVIRVAYETGPKALDDVLVEYAPEHAPRDHEARPYYRRHIQCKYRTQHESFGYADLVDPAFIGAPSVSFLQRVYEAQQAYAPDGIGCRFELLTNWRIAANDPLLELVDAGRNAIRLDRLFEGKTDRSRMGAVRMAWREHLGIDDDSLRLVARVLAIAHCPDSFPHLRERLDDRFKAVGLKRIAMSESAFLYDSLFQELHDQGRTDFDRDSFREMVVDEGLLGAPILDAGALTVGIRSFMHPIDNLESRSDRMLDLVSYFDGRHIREPSDWQVAVLPDVREFVLEAARDKDRLRIVLDAHASLAFTVGTVLDVKSGKAIEIEQRTGGRRFWSMNDVPADPAWPQIVFEDVEISDTGDEIAVGIGLTHDVGPAVRAFATQNLPNIRRILVCTPEDGPSQKAIRCGHHAWLLAEAVAQRVSSLRGSASTPTTSHLFIAGPNGFTFFLGQHHRTIGAATVYEWDFERNRGGGYSPGVTVGV